MTPVRFQTETSEQLSIRQASCKPRYFSWQLSVPEGIGIIAEFKGKREK